MTLSVYTEPEPRWLSRAMYRVSSALKRYVPDNVDIVDDASDADIQVLHVIGTGARNHLQARDYAVIQYCYGASYSKGPNELVSDGGKFWAQLWADKLVWSYYDLADDMPSTSTFYLAPLGVDSVFQFDPSVTHRDIGVITSGYVTGPGAEAIEEVAIAANRLGMRVVHLGPKPEGMNSEPGTWSHVTDLSDSELAKLYSRALYVSGLRHIEGFELPVIEGAAMGCVPIVFDRVDMHQWYGVDSGLGTRFVLESSGESLVLELMKVLRAGVPQPRYKDMSAFQWETIAGRFWELLLEHYSL